MLGSITTSFCLRLTNRNSDSSIANYVYTVMERRASACGHSLLFCSLLPTPYVLVWGHVYQSPNGNHTT